VNADLPFAVTGFTNSIAVKAGASVNLGVTLFGTNPGDYNGELTMTFDVLQPLGVTLTGSIMPTSVPAVTTFAQLPSGAVNSAYYASLTAAGGMPPYTWTVAPGSQLPSGLSLSSSGQITGTLGAGVGIGTYPFSVQVSDATNVTATETLSLAVGAVTTGSTAPVCNNIYYPNLTRL
jgi:large repetitive protein